MRFFEKISYNQFIKDISDDKNLYENYKLPTRSTKCSAGYDIKSLNYAVLKPGESKIFYTGIKACMNSDEVLYLYIRSSMGFNKSVTLVNNVGVIDSDYYNNINNEGHIQIKLINNGNEDFIVNIGDKIAQGVFMKYLVVDDETEIKATRIGGIGSTNRKENI